MPAPNGLQLPENTTLSVKLECGIILPSASATLIEASVASPFILTLNLSVFTNSIELLISCEAKFLISTGILYSQVLPWSESHCGFTAAERRRSIFSSCFTDARTLEGFFSIPSMLKSSSHAIPVLEPSASQKHPLSFIFAVPSGSMKSAPEPDWPIVMLNFFQPLVDLSVVKISE